MIPTPKEFKRFELNLRVAFITTASQSELIAFPFWAPSGRCTNEQSQGRKKERKSHTRVICISATPRNYIDVLKNNNNVHR